MSRKALSHSPRGRSGTVTVASVALLALLLALALSAANILLGNLNQDEGWYLIAALRTGQGQFPYRDFLFTQGPVMPVVYGALSPLWASFGILGGRVLTAFFGLTASALAALLAARLAPPRFRPHAAIGAWLLISCSPVHSYFTAIPKTYGLAAFLLLAGFAVLTNGGGMQAFTGGLFLGLATATRISLGPALPIVFLALWLWRSQPPWRGAWLGFGTGAALALALTYGLSLLHFGDSLLFAQSYHATRDAGGLGNWIALRAGFASRTLQAYPLLWSLCLVLLLIRPASWRSDPVRAAVWLSAAAVTALHALSPFPYDDYQTPVMPLLAAAAAAALWHRLDETSVTRSSSRVPDRLLLGLAGLTLLFALASPLLMDWMVIRKDRFWFERKTRPDLLVLREQGRWVREHVPAGMPLLTQDAYLAVEARRDVPAGLEMGPFSIFPDLTDEEALRYKVHTPATLARLIQHSDAPLAATSGYSFALACPGTEPLAEADRCLLFQALAEKYEPVRTVPDFGQAHTTLTLWTRRDAAVAAKPEEIRE